MRLVAVDGLHFAHINIDSYGVEGEIYALDLERLGTHGLEITVFRRQNSRDRKVYGGLLEPDELAKWMVQSMALGKGADEIQELTQDAFINLMDGEDPILILLRKTS